MLRPFAGRRWAAWLLALLLALAAQPQARSAAPPTLTILHFNDDYQLTALDQGKAGGLDRIATLVKQYRKADPRTLLLFAGDLLSPSLESSVFQGAQLIDGFNHLGVDAAVLGNHEFDYGPDVLLKRLRESRFPWVTTNVMARGMRPFPGLHPYLIYDVGGIRVGIFGLLTEDTAITSQPGPNVLFMSAVGAAKAIVPILRRQGAQVVIGLTHLFMEEDQAIVRAVPGISVVIGGHEHVPLQARVGNVLIAKAGVDARWLGVTRLTLGPDGAVTNTTHQLVTVDERVPSDPPMAALIKRYSDHLNRELGVEIGSTQVPLDARTSVVRTRESALGDFIADVMRQAVQADVAIMNGGGIRSDAVLPAGPIRRRDVVAWMPFGNVIVKLRVTGAQLREALENGVSQIEQGAGRFPQVSGMGYTYDPRRPRGQRVLSVTVGGQPLNPDAFYTVATNDFLANGGDGYAMLKQAEVVIGPAGGPGLATTVIAAIERARTIAPREDGRIQVVR